jgi:hypothetical protein
MFRSNVSPPSLSVVLRIVLQFLVTTNVVPSSLILSTLMTEAIRSTETSVLKRATRRHGIVHAYDCSSGYAATLAHDKYDSNDLLCRACTDTRKNCQQYAI